MKAVARTHIGRVRRSNQDSLLALPQCPVYAVADGMGGHLGGDTASLMAIEGLRALCQSRPSTEAIVDCYQRISRAIYLRQLSDENLRGMGTTLTMLWETERSVLLGHVGDSRAYLLRAGELRQMSSDHSLVQEMVQKGLLESAQAASYPYRNVITRAVGTEETVLCDTAVYEKLPGDRWLLCSDGLSEYVNGSLLLETMSLSDLDEAADRMVVRALEGGGRDNISLVLLEAAP